MTDTTHSVTEKVSPKDVFTHLLAIVALYASAVSFLVLVFQYVNISFPDAVNQGSYYSISSSYQSIRWSIAMLVVMFPLYLFTMRALNRSYAEAPDMRNLRIRKWLVYFTLFVAALVIAGDVVALIYNFLEGELTIRFLLKVAAVLFVAGSIFWYYFKDLKQAGDRMKVFVYAIAGIVGIAIVGGALRVGSPAAERMRKTDMERVQSLQMLQSELINYWQSKEALPAALDELNDDLRGFRVPVDPETKTTYGYERNGTREFSLCATFAMPSEIQNDAVSKPRPMYDVYGSSWDHGAGIHCFERTIDPELFPPRPSIK